MFGFRPGSEFSANAMACAPVVGMRPSNQPVWVPVSFRTTRVMESPLELATLTTNSSTSAVRLRSGSITLTLIGFPGLTILAICFWNSTSGSGSSSARTFASRDSAAIRAFAVASALRDPFASISAISFSISSKRCSSSVSSLRADAMMTASEATVIGPPRCSGMSFIRFRKRSE